MKVKVKDNIYDANNEPIMLIFDNDEELKGVINNLINMKPTNNSIIRKYLIFPDSMDVNIAKEFMKINN